MTLIGFALNGLLVILLGAALVMGYRLNRRLTALRESHQGFATAVHDLNLAAVRAEQGLAKLRIASDEAIDLLADRIDKGRQLAAKLEKLVQQAPSAARLADAQDDRVHEQRLGMLLGAAREARAKPERAPPREVLVRAHPAFEDDLFEDEPRSQPAARFAGARR